MRIPSNEMMSAVPKMGDERDSRADENVKWSDGRKKGCVPRPLVCALAASTLGDVATISDKSAMAVSVLGLRVATNSAVGKTFADAFE